MNKYDYIIAGAGCAGLSLAVHMIHSGKFSNKKILLIDKDDKKQNDRTWSFWETEPGLFEQAVYRSWKKTWFHSADFSRLLDLTPYRYKMIRGIDFYRFCISLIEKQSNFTIRKETVQSVGNEGSLAFIELKGEKVFADHVFSSLLFDKPDLKRKEHYLLQHFKGWVIETTEPAFNPDEPVLMDFRTSQEQGTTFVYVKPFTSTSGLIEYTLFTGKLLSDAQYEEGLRDYIERFITRQPYKILETEKGIIPMTDHEFPAMHGRVIYTGTAGGQTRGSSGYTFQFIQKHSARIVESLTSNGHPYLKKPANRRARFYDSVLLHILQHRQFPGDRIFTGLFKKNKPQRVLRFLDNETSFGEELRIISSLPAGPFLKAAMQQR